MEASQPPQPPLHKARSAGCKACPSCKAPAEEGRLVRCPRCHATSHMECVWDHSRCGSCGYDLEDEARRLAVVWVERSARWLLQLPARWAARSREGVLEQRRSYGSLCASSVLLTAALTVALVIVVRVLFPEAHLV